MQSKTQTQLLHELVSLKGTCIEFPLNTTMTTTFEDLGADSLDLVELVMETEKHFQISIDGILIESLRTVGDLVAIIEKELNARTRAASIKPEPISENAKQTLKEKAENLKNDAEAIERNCLIMVENEVGDGFDVFVYGSVNKVSEMIAVGSKHHQKFRSIIEHALVKISVKKLDDMLAEKKSLLKKEETQETISK